MAKESIICGREFTPGIIAGIRTAIAGNEELTRNQLSRRVCQWLNWRDEKGRYKEVSCRVALLRMQEQGVLELPEARGQQRTRERDYRSGEGQQQEVISAAIGAIKGLRLELVTGRGRELSLLWNEMIDRHHYFFAVLDELERDHGDRHDHDGYDSYALHATSSVMTICSVEPSGKYIGRPATYMLPIIALCLSEPRSAPWPPGSPGASE